MSLAQGSVPPTSLSVASAQPSTSTAPPSMGCIQFPPGTALGSQLASAALLGRALPTAAAQQLPVKVIMAFVVFFCFIISKVWYYLIVCFLH